MTFCRTQRGQIMLIILGTLFVGSGAATGVFSTGKSIKSMRAEIKSMPFEAARRDHILGLIDQWETVATPASEGYSDYAKMLLELVADQTTTRSQLEEALQLQRAELGHVEDQLLPLRDELKSTLKREEWNRIFQ